jgi:hypothetical protein
VSPSDEPPMMDIARGDATASRQIRRNLEILRENSRNPEFRSLIQEVLDGRRSLREVAGSGVFTSEITPYMQTFTRKWEEATARDQDVLPAQDVEEFHSLKAEAARRTQEIEDQIRELRRLQQDLDASG